MIKELKSGEWDKWFSSCIIPISKSQKQPPCRLRTSELTKLHSNTSAGLLHFASKSSFNLNFDLCSLLFLALTSDYIFSWANFKNVVNSSSGDVLPPRACRYFLRKEYILVCGGRGDRLVEGWSFAILPSLCFVSLNCFWASGNRRDKGEGNEEISLGSLEFHAWESLSLAHSTSKHGKNLRFLEREFWRNLKVLLPLMLFTEFLFPNYFCWKCWKKLSLSIGSGRSLAEVLDEPSGHRLRR